MKTEWLIKTPTDFKSLIDSLLTELEKQKSTMLCLQGDLGAGKTAFTQELGKYLGVAEKIVSPTFVVMKNYETSHEVYEQLNHIDAYRIESEAELMPLRMEDQMTGDNRLTCIEWPERITDSIPASAVWLTFEILPDEVRRVTITLSKGQ